MVGGISPSRIGALLLCYKSKRTNRIAHGIKEQIDAFDKSLNEKVNDENFLLPHGEDVYVYLFDDDRDDDNATIPRWSRSYATKRTRRRTHLGDCIEKSNRQDWKQSRPQT